MMGTGAAARNRPGDGEDNPGHGDDRRLPDPAAKPGGHDAPTAARALCRGTWTSFRTAK